jgi:hypothetical protein
MMMIPLTTFLADTNNGQSAFQIDHFITIRSGGTLYGCYHQACRELASRVSALADCLTSIEEAGTKIDHADFKAQNHPSRHLRDVARVKSQRLRFSVGQLTQRLAELDQERWEYHIRCQIAVELFTQGRPGRNTVGALRSMPAAMRKRIGEDCLSSDEAQRRCIACYFEYSPDTPAPLALSDGQQEELIARCESSLLPKRLRHSSPTDARPSPSINAASDWKSATAARSAAGTAARNAEVLSS